MVQDLRSGFRHDGLLTSGTAVELTGLDKYVYPLTVYVEPGSGCTVTVEYKLGAGSYQAWSQGGVTAFASATFVSPISSLRFTRSAGSATDSKYGVL